MVTKNLLAGQHHQAGSVLISSDASNLYVTHQMANNWELRKTHLFAGDCNSIPTNKSGNPQNGQFPYKASHTNGTVTYTYSIPLANLPACMCIAAHAEVVKVDNNGNIIQSETGWGEGTSFHGKNWAMYFDYCKQECTEVPNKCYKEESAWSNGIRYVNQGNWATYTTYNNTQQSVILFAGQNTNAGTVTFTSIIPTNKLNITIDLDNGWMLNGGSESVKIQGYNNVPPAQNPSPGLFNTYKGNSLNITTNAYQYYGIHVDVKIEVYCDNEIN